MFDTHATARALTDAGADPELSDAITDAVKKAADHGDHVTRDMLRAELKSLEASVTWRALGTAGIAIAALRLLGSTSSSPASDATVVQGRLNVHSAGRPVP